MQLHEVLGIIGFLLLMLGAAAMDSDPVLIPVVMALLGLVCLYLEDLYEKYRERRRRIRYMQKLLDAISQIRREP